MQNITLKMMNIEIYGKICMAGYTITKYNPLTMHHIIPMSQGGFTCPENSSNVTNSAHRAIHIVSDDNRKKEKQIIDYLFQFKEHPDELAAKQFAVWLDNEARYLGYEQTAGRNKLLTYTRRYKR